MAADVVTLGAALVATTIATRPDTTGRRSYGTKSGSYRVEVFASLLAVVLMLAVALYVVIEAIGRIGGPADVSSGPTFIVGTIGLVVNVVTLLMLRSGASESLNVKGAYLEAVVGTAGSVGVIIAGWLVATTGQTFWDTVVALAIGVFVAVRAIGLGRQVFAVLGQHVPEGVEASAVAADLAAIDGVRDVHDLHLWTLTSGMNVATAHLVTGAQDDNHALLDQARDLLRPRRGVAHATLQVEPSEHGGCDELGR
jgi:cobalt-zinc-cadmium efflux system protein